MIIADAKRRLDLLAAQSLLQLWLVFAPAPQVQRLLEEAKTSDKAEDGAAALKRAHELGKTLPSLWSFHACVTDGLACSPSVQYYALLVPVKHGEPVDRKKVALVVKDELVGLQPPWEAMVCV